ncbi:MAG: hypothetical protein ACKV2V_31175 [Blastocatellia bacterium]
MDKYEKRRFDWFKRVREFGTQHQVDFPQGSACGKLFADLGQVILDLENSNASQTGERNNARQSTTNKKAAREQLYATIFAMHRAARVMSRVTPGLTEKFALPRKNEDLAVLATARAFAAAAEPLEADFVAHNMPDDFLPQLRAQIERMEGELTRRTQAWTDQKTATSAIDAAVTRGIDLVKSLNDLIRIKYVPGTDGLRKWDIAYRQDRVGRRSGAGGNAGTTPGEGNGEPATPVEYSQMSDVRCQMSGDG